MTTAIRALTILLCLCALPALAEKRVALVIGNSAYVHAPVLPNPKNDAEGMAAALKRLDFEVLAGTDLAKPAMEKLLQAFSLKLETADVALVFYAGHGLQVNGRNYLVPVDGKLDREADLVFQAVPLDVIQGLMEQSQRTNIMILDACRDNPLARNLARSMGTRSTGIGRGLGETKAGIGTLIVYATQPGNVALDGEGGNSPFTAALLAHLETKGLEVRQVLTRVRQAVIQNTKGKQVPWDSSSLTGDFFFVAAPAARETPPGVTPPPPAPPAPPSTADNEALFWQSIKDSKNAADYKAYLARYPQGVFAELAKIRIAELEKADVTPPAPAPEPPKPAPGPARRTSTVEVGVSYGTSADRILGTYADSVQACQSLCLQNPKCMAWVYIHNPSSPPHMWGPRHKYCSLLGRVGARGLNEPTTSGVIRTTPAAAAPDKPAARTSTLEAGMEVSGTSLTQLSNVASAPACQAHCLQRANCMAWEYRTAEWQGPARLTCELFSAVSRRGASALKSIVSGVIRTTPAAAPAPPRSTPVPPRPPAPPAQPKRTSTWEPGIVFSSIIGVGWGSSDPTASPNECMALCLREPRCKYWYHRSREPARCFLMGTTGGRSKLEGGYVAGEIRDAQGQ